MINLPNQITIVRLLLAIVFFVLMSRYDVITSPDAWILDACTALFMVAAMTDVLDGYLARRNNQVTAFGRMLDPFVDKVLVCGAFVFLAGPGFRTAEGVQITHLSSWMVVLILGRELLVTGLRGFSESKGEAFGANIYGKAKMMFQSLTIPILLLLVAHGDEQGSDSNRLAKDILVWSTVVVTTLSMLPYLYQSKDILSQTRIT
ncbi:MAG: CDP-diacylglycerol--glycerol-3-phosphate 3-phosphatidyltransferase [Planctomycetes bacterium]|nr:CDP-diacylglycerol--glycerol-3-phosphate 3-phosphatidyltransferase [Planctomycetota bacterium]